MVFGTKDIKLVLVKATQTSAGTDVTSDIIDSSGYDGVAFFGAIHTANAGNFIKVQQGAVSTMSDAADLAGTKVVAASNGQCVLQCIQKPLERYLRAVIVRAGANTVTGEIYALCYSGSKLPESFDVAGANGLVSEFTVSPAEGTA